MKTFTVNGKEYKAKEFDFNLMCDLEDMGISIADVEKKPTVALRAYFALCTGKGKDFAGKEIGEHIVNGGSLEDVANVMTEAMENSDFFRSLNETAEAENAKSKSKTKQSTKA